MLHSLQLGVTLYVVIYALSTVCQYLLESCGMGAVRKLNKLLVELLAGSSRVGSIAEPVVEGGSPFTVVAGCI